MCDRRFHDAIPVARFLGVGVSTEQAVVDRHRAQIEVIPVARFVGIPESLHSSCSSVAVGLSKKSIFIVCMPACSPFKTYGDKL